MIIVFAFDTLGYTKRLRDAGIPGNHAETHAEAARDFIMAELVTKPDLFAFKSDLTADIHAVRAELRTVRADLTADLRGVEADLKSEISSVRTGLKAEILSMRSDLQAAIDKSALQMTLRLGGLVTVGVGLLAALQRMH